MDTSRGTAHSCSNTWISFGDGEHPTRSEAKNITYLVTSLTLTRIQSPKMVLHISTILLLLLTIGRRRLYYNSRSEATHT